MCHQPFITLCVCGRDVDIEAVDLHTQARFSPNFPHLLQGFGGLGSETKESVCVVAHVLQGFGG